MNEDQRAQVRDNARYLRQVRPLDPDEISSYVDGTPHPAAIRQVLREEATDIGIVEREDGRFEPVDDEPVSVQFSGVETLPRPISRAFEDVLVEEIGPGWPDGTSGERLRAAIREFKHKYLAEESVTYDTVTALGYAIYHLPAYFAAVQYVLDELATDGLLARQLRVLDIGAGTGGPALGLEEYLPDDALVEYHAVEPSAAADVLEQLLETTGRNFHWQIHREQIESFEPGGNYDIILCANVLSELDTPAAVLESTVDWLASDGTVVALAPADRNTATQLRSLERDIERRTDATVYGPTVRLWPDETPRSESWSFTRKADVAVPPFQRRLAEHATDPEEFENVDVQYAYSLLRTDGKRAIEFTPNPARVAKFGEMETHVTERIDCVGIKLSHDLSDDGHPLFLLGDGSERIDHFAVLTDPSALNRPLEEAAYGELLSLENVLVLWNDDEAAYNLVVDGESFVERLGR